MTEDVRKEIIGGEAVVSPLPEGAEQEAALTIEIALREYAQERGAWVSDGPREVCFDENHVLVPDVVYLAPDQAPLVEGRKIRGTPTLVVEVLSGVSEPSFRDGKANVYASRGVPEYWRVDCESQTVERWTQPDEGRYSKIEVFVEDLWSEALPDFVLPLEEVFAAPPGISR